MKHTLILCLCLVVSAISLAQTTDSLPAGARVAPWATQASANGAKASAGAGNGREGLLEPPESWGFSRAYSQTLPSDDRWWRQFEDPVLDKLIDMAENANFNIRTALRRMEIARQTINQTKAGYYPTVGASAGYTVERGAGAITSPAAKGNTLNYMNLGLSAQWEIDLFGRIGEQLKADKARVNLSKADYEAAMVSLCSELAKAYIHLRVLLVKEASVSTDQRGKYLYVLDKEDRVVYRPVTVGQSYQDTLCIIEKGLEPGERYVTDALLTVRPGMKVKPHLVK